MVVTRTGKTESVPESKKKDITKTPRQSITKTPTSVDKRVRHDPGPTSSNVVAQRFICSICKNTEDIRVAALDTNTGTLLEKLNSAKNAFSDSMSKVENFSLNLRHFLVSGTDEAESQQTLITSLQSIITEISDKTKLLEGQIIKNENILLEISKSVQEFKESIPNRQFTDIDDNNHFSMNNAENTFSINSSGRRVIREPSKISENSTKHIDNLESDFLLHELRTSLCKYLEGCHNFIDRDTHNMLTIGQPHKTLVLLVNRQIFPLQSARLLTSFTKNSVYHRKICSTPLKLLNFKELIPNCQSVRIQINQYHQTS